LRCVAAEGRLIEGRSWRQAERRTNHSIWFAVL